MGMGYGANYADVVETKFFLEHCPKEFKSLTKLLAEYKLTWQEFHYIVRDNFEEAGDILLQVAYESFQVACEKATGLIPHINYHDCDEEGDRYDEVDEAYWHVEGVWDRTAAGEKYKNVVERKFFVTFG